jgi:hypothetical protein
VKESEFAQLFPRASRSTVRLNSDPAASPCLPDKKNAVHRPSRASKAINQTEREYELILKREYGQKSVYYERYTLRLAPDLRYTPDLVVIGRRFALDFYEIKNRRHIFDRSLHKPKLAAQLYPWHRFFIAIRELSGQWTVTQISRLP